MIESLSEILGKKPQNEVAILLQESVLPSIPPIGFWIGQVLGSIEFDYEATIRI